jgi:DNA-binding winged helix-turn-helix (wHTH) protein/methylglyoxal synthase
LSNRVYRFGNFTLDLKERLLLEIMDGNPQVINLEPKAFDLLVVFLKKPGQLLLKSELMEMLWEEKYVNEGNLTTNVRSLRKALKDSAENPRYIQTHFKAGYRWVATVKDDLEGLILKALEDSDYALRNLDGLALQTRMHPSELEPVLMKLRVDQLIEMKVEEGGLRCWYITHKGRAFVAEGEQQASNSTESTIYLDQVERRNFMSTEKQALGIIASDFCKGSGNTQPPIDKPWFHIRKFIRQHHEVLNRFEIYATNGTADIIDETNVELKKEIRPLKAHRVGHNFTGVVQLAAMVAKGKIDRILFFEDPADVELEHPENYALLRNCNLNGKGLFINEAAHLWAQQMGNLGPMKPRRESGKLNGKNIDIRETVVLIAHDGEKDRLARLMLRYYVVFNRFRLLATSVTKAYLDKFLKATLPSTERLEISAAGESEQDLAGARGGDVIIADEVLSIFTENPGLLEKAGPLYHVLFFIDHREFLSPTIDTRILIRAFARPELRVNLIFNSCMAEEWLVRYIEPATK